MKIDPKRVESINNIPLPRNRKEIQVFLGKINFMRRSKPNYVAIVKEITEILKKDKEFKWTIEARESFSKIKNAFIESLVLASPYCQRSFLIFSFSSPNMVAVVLLWKNNEG